MPALSFFTLPSLEFLEQRLRSADGWGLEQLGLRQIAQALFYANLPPCWATRLPNIYSVDPAGPSCPVVDFVCEIAAKAEGGAALLSPTTSAQVGMVRCGLVNLPLTAPNWLPVVSGTINVIGCIPTGDSRAGTCSSAIGMMWIDPRKIESVEMASRSIIHECIHSLLFYYDLAFGLFVLSEDEMHADGAVATSAIRNMKRRYDLAFHSAVVSYELLRLNTVEHREESASALYICLADLVNRQDVLTDIGRDLLREMARHSI